jgi:hypothetical protein
MLNTRTCRVTVNATLRNKRARLRPQITTHLSCISVDIQEAKKVNGSLYRPKAQGGVASALQWPGGGGGGLGARATPQSRFPPGKPGPDFAVS